MKNAPTTISNESALDKCDYTVGVLPVRVDTVTADVLASMLEGRTMTGLESVFKQGSTRLAGAINYLQTDYGWTISRKSMVAGTSDGRTPEVTVYWLSQGNIAKSFENGARDWINEVRKVRAELRKGAESCFKKAAKINAARLADPRQCNLWEGK